MSADEKHDEEQAGHIPKNNVANESPMYNELSVTLDLPRTSMDYVDCSQLNVKEMLKHRPGSLSKETFPTKLHKILSNPQYRNIISWLQHGRSWRVLDPKAFQEEVVPKYFRHRKLSSFMRQVNGWGFHRANEGVDHHSYYHEYFLRGLPHLCKLMSRMGGKQCCRSTPDFHSMSLKQPLPELLSNDVLSELRFPSSYNQSGIEVGMKRKFPLVEENIDAISRVLVEKKQRYLEYLDKTKAQNFLRSNFSKNIQNQKALLFPERGCKFSLGTIDQTLIRTNLVPNEAVLPLLQETFRNKNATTQTTNFTSDQHHFPSSAAITMPNTALNSFMSAQQSLQKLIQVREHDIALMAVLRHQQVSDTNNAYRYMCSLQEQIRFNQEM